MKGLGAVFALALAAAACGERQAERARSRPLVLPAGVEPVRITMDMLHQAGGVPPGWRLTLPAGDVPEGRRTFVQLGCHSCHAVKGETFSPAGDASHVGPDLTGMGSHHPAAYFAESILSPDAVLIDAPGYVTADGHSRMPTYPDLTVAQLADLVAYLGSLSDPTGMSPPDRGSTGLAPRPAPPRNEAGVFLVQVYDVKEGQLQPFEDWFRTQAAPALRAVDGLVSVDTWVDNTRPAAPVLTMMAFRDDASLSRFLTDPAGAAIKQKFDEFIGPHGHQIFRTPPIYRAPGLSAP